MIYPLKVLKSNPKDGKVLLCIMNDLSTGGYEVGSYGQRSFLCVAECHSSIKMVPFYVLL